MGAGARAHRARRHLGQRTGPDDRHVRQRPADVAPRRDAARCRGDRRPGRRPALAGALAPRGRAGARTRQRPAARRRRGPYQRGRVRRADHGAAGGRVRGLPGPSRRRRRPRPAGRRRTPGARLRAGRRGRRPPPALLTPCPPTIKEVLGIKELLGIMRPTPALRIGPQRLPGSVAAMHSVDRTTEQMIRSVLAYAENRLRLDPVPLDRGAQPPEVLEAVFGGLLGEKGGDPDQVLGIYTSTIAPSVISADSPRFLGFIPSAPTKASLLFDMLVSCASIQGISWLEAAGAVHAENQVLRLLADLAGLPADAGGAFVSGGSAGNLSALAFARDTARGRRGDAGEEQPRRWRIVVSSDAHSSVVNTLRLLELGALVVRTD